MKHILLNLSSFFKHEKTIFFLILLCVISSSFIINFSYGLYYNFNIQKEEANETLRDVFFTAMEYNEEGYPEGWRYIEGLTKKDLQQYIEALSEKVINAVDAFLADSFLAELADEEHLQGSRNIFHFTYHNGKYGITEKVKNNIKSNGGFVGRYFTDEEMAKGKRVAIINNSIDLRQNYPDLWVDDETICLFGEHYEVIGGGKIAGELQMPFTSLPDEQYIVIFEVQFSENLTRDIYNEMKEKANEIIPGKLYFPELEGIDRDDMAIYNNMIAISLCISILSVINFALLYHFVMEKRQKQLAIMRMCGCKKTRALFTYLGECVLMTLPSYCIGILINHLLVNNVLNSTFDYIDEAYNPKVYGTLFSVYAAVFTVILLIMITNNVNRTVAEEWKG